MASAAETGNGGRSAPLPPPPPPGWQGVYNIPETTAPSPGAIPDETKSIAADPPGSDGADLGEAAGLLGPPNKPNAEAAPPTPGAVPFKADESEETPPHQKRRVQAQDPATAAAAQLSAAVAGPLPAVVAGPPTPAATSSPVQLWPTADASAVAFQHAAYAQAAYGGYYAHYPTPQAQWGAAMHFVQPAGWTSYQPSPPGGAWIASPHGPAWIPAPQHAWPPTPHLAAPVSQPYEVAAWPPQPYAYGPPASAAPGYAGYGEYAALAQPQLQPPLPQHQPAAAGLQSWPNEAHGRPAGDHSAGKRGRPGPGFSKPLPAYVHINKQITQCFSLEAILALVRERLPEFDSVCMATALHMMASLRAPALQYQALSLNADFQRLLDTIGDKIAAFTARNLANTMWALAKMGYDPGPKVLELLKNETLKKINGFNAQNIANTLWAFANLGFHPGQELLGKMADAAGALLPSFSSQNISNAAMAFAKLDFHPGGLLKSIAEVALAKLDSFTPQALSNTAWAFSRLEEWDVALLDAIAVHARLRMHQFNAQNVANTVWAYANLNFDPGLPLLDAIAGRARADLAQYSAQNVSNTLWAFAKLGHAPEGLLRDALAHVLVNLHDFSPQSVANTLWACATLQYAPSEHALDRLASHCQLTIDGFSPQNISNSLWAFATIGYCPTELLKKALAEIVQRLSGPSASTFSRQHLSNTMWAVATLEADAGKTFLAQVARAMAQRAGECNPQEISNTVWAYARLRFYDSTLMVRMAAEAEAQIEAFSQQNLANLAWAYGKLSHYQVSLMDAVARQATLKVKELSLQHISNILWTNASFLHLPPDMVSSFVAEVRARLKTDLFNAQQLSNVLWSLCICQNCDEDIWDAAMGQFERLIGSSSHGESGIACLPEEALTQIYQSHLLMQLDRPHPAALRMPPGLHERARAQWAATCLNVRVSQLHQDVAHLVRGLGASITIEQLTDDRLFSIDIAIPAERIAIEVDGPHHFTANTLQPLGEMLARRKLLEARGWAVVSVPFFQWSNQSDEHRVAFVQQELQKARQQLAERHDNRDNSLQPRQTQAGQ